MEFIKDIEYATSFCDKEEARDIIRILDDIDFRYKITPYEGMFVIQIIDRDTEKFLGFYSD